MLLRKKQGNCSIGDYVWPEDDAVVEVPDWMAEELLAIPGHDYEEVLPHTEAHEANADWAPVETADEQGVVEDGVESAGLRAQEALDVLRDAADGAVDADDVPDGTAAAVLAWVGDDKERAAKALAVEEAKGYASRETLKAKLKRLAG